MATLKINLICISSLPRETKLVFSPRLFSCFLSLSLVLKSVLHLFFFFFFLVEDLLCLFESPFA